MKTIIKEMKACNMTDDKEKQRLVSHFQNTWENSEYSLRLKEGMELIKNHLAPKLSPSSLQATKAWMHRFEGDLNKKIDNEMQKIEAEGTASIENEASDLTCLKETLGLDDFLMENIFTLGQEFLKKKEFHLAASIFTVLTFLDPLSSDSMISLALAESGLGNDENAERALGMALFLDPEDLSILYHVGHYYLDKGDKKTANGFFKIILDSKKSTQPMKEHCNKLVA